MKLKEKKNEREVATRDRKIRGKEEMIDDDEEWRRKDKGRNERE